jgi:hypothetical protein
MIYAAKLDPASNLRKPFIIDVTEEKCDEK